MRPYPPENEDEVEPILDTHPHDFLGLIQVDELIVESNEKQHRDPSRKTLRNLAVLAIRPPNDRGNDKTARQTDDELVDVLQTTEENLDSELIYEDTILTHEQTFADMAVKENLETQKDDLFFAGIIRFLQTGQLPKNKDEAQRIAVQAENFYIENDQLYHLAVMRGKRLNLIRPAFTQLCTPKRYRVEALERYHNFGHVGFLKTYLTIKQVHFWPGMSFDLQHFIKTCDTCQRIKRDANAPRPKLTSLPVR
jgi:Integrase zinc binding domain